MRRRAGGTVLAGLGAVVAVVATACSSSDPAPAPAPSSAGSTPTTAAAAPADASLAACTAYAGATGNPRTVLDSVTAGPVIIPAVALALINYRTVAAAQVLPEDPELVAALAETVNAVDSLVTELNEALPEGADLNETPVAADPSRLAAALDATDALCTDRGVAPGQG